MMNRNTLIQNYFKNEKLRLYSSSPNEYDAHYFKGIDTRHILESTKGDDLFPIKGDLRAERKWFNLTQPLLKHFLHSLKRSNYNARVFVGEGESEYKLTQSNIFEVIEEIKNILRDNIESLENHYEKYCILATDSGQRGLGAKPEFFKLKEL